MSDWKIHFTIDALRDIVTATFEHVEIATPRDVARWASEVETRFKTFGRPVDLLIDLTGLNVKPAAARAFGEVRRQVLAKYTQRSFRYGGDRATATAVYTSSVLTGAAANIFATREEALAALLQDRARR